MKENSPIDKSSIVNKIHVHQYAVSEDSNSIKYNKTRIQTLFSHMQLYLYMYKLQLHENVIS